MWLLLLGLIMVVAYPFSADLFFSPIHPNPLFLIAHESLPHLAINLFSIILVWLIARRTGTRQKNIIGTFFIASFASILFSWMFNLPVIGASVGIYGMIGYLLPEMVAWIPLHWSYSILSVLILFDGGLTANPWEKLFHFLGLNFGMVFKYMTDARRLSLMRQMRRMGMGFDMYAALGAAYPSRTTLRYNFPSDKN